MTLLPIAGPISVLVTTMATLFWMMFMIASFVYVNNDAMDDEEFHAQLLAAWFFNARWWFWTFIMLLSWIIMLNLKESDNGPNRYDTDPPRVHCESDST